ncbi:hypothetical protein VTJ83DRAFT_7116 [Remersonia thermophila]|uniref:Complex 1 LYR protein domain-containing protein n=1 Tax=Remersonia thermophila TaxID=72144 RepID=A0ABR4D437_9PEZI
MPSQFFPARSSRHRTACFALYRALLRTAQRVPLPDDLTTSSPLAGPTPTQHPLRTLIRNAFHRNRNDTSPRLVVSALKNGYRFLTLLSRAAEASDPPSPERASVVAFLRRNQERVLQIKAKLAAEREAWEQGSTAPIPDRQTVIKRVSPDGVWPPVYAPAIPVRPLSAFRDGIRRPPVLGHAMGIPFLRFKKPQPRFLERVLRQKAMRRHKRIGIMTALAEDGMADAQDEDLWEEQVEKLLADASRKRRGREGGGKLESARREPTYAESLKEAIGILVDLTNKEHDDLVARGRAMWQIVVAEREQALKEEKERLERLGRGGEEPKLRDRRRPLALSRRPKEKKKRDEKTKGKTAEGGNENKRAQEAGGQGSTEPSDASAVAPPKQ